MITHKWLAGILLAIHICFATSAYGGEPLELVESTTESVVALLKDPAFKGTEKKPERVEKLKAIINPIFDYEEIAMRTLGKHWRSRSLADQQEFTQLFRAFLEKIYSDRIDLYDGERLVFGRETIDAEHAVVEAKLINRKREESRLIYRMKRSRGSWKVYDAVVSDISIITNYRSQFDRVISKSSFEELKRMLREKVH